MTHDTGFTAPPVATASVHLSPDTLDDLLIDPASPDLALARAHLTGCPTCRAALDANKALLDGFALDAHAQAAEAMSRLVMRPPADGLRAPARASLGTIALRLLRPVPLAGLAGATAAAVTAVALLVSSHPGNHWTSNHRTGGTGQPETAALTSTTSAASVQARSTSGRADTAEDEALLTDISRDLSRSVAGPLQPLSDPLLSQSSNGSSGSSHN